MVQVAAELTPTKITLQYLENDASQRSFVFHRAFCNDCRK